MTYIEGNPQTKTELYKRHAAARAKGRSLYAFQPGGLYPLKSGRVVLAGPHYPQPHRWYCQATVDAEGAIVHLDGFDAWARAEARKASGAEAPKRKRSATRAEVSAWMFSECSARPTTDNGGRGHYLDPRRPATTRITRCQYCRQTLGEWLDAREGRL